MWHDFNINRKGDLAELKAMVWLIEQGYEVYRNVCSTGPADISVWDVETGEAFVVDVKTGSKQLVNGVEYVMYGPAHDNVRVLVYIPDEDRCVWADDMRKVKKHKRPNRGKRVVN